MTVFRPIVCAAWLACCGALHAQTVPAPARAYDVNVYPQLSDQSGLYNLNVAPSQKGPPGTIALTNATPAPAYSFADVMANTHGFISAGVSTGSGHEFSAGVSIPIVPGKAELDLAASTGQLPSFKLSGLPGKPPAVTYDSYSAGLALHPAENVEAFVGFTDVRLHTAGGGAGNAFLMPGVNAFPNP